METRWYEIWVDDTMSTPCPYTLVVIGDPANQAFSIFDPKEDYKVLFKSDDYEVLKKWLLEDEYTRVVGRMEREE